MSKNFNKVKLYYDRQVWSYDMVKRAVGLWITANEFLEITGEEFEEKK
ncbi:hypothetical protein LXJ15735_11550 [Lacrimispora xylanolytica]